MSSGPIRFTCSKCGGNIRAPAGQSGETVQCPRCHAAVTVPAEGNEATTSPAPLDAVEKLPTSSARRSRPEPPPRFEDGPLPPADGPIRIDEFGVQADEFSVTCPVCGTSVSATPAQIGAAVTCPDCFSPVPVLPRPAGPAEAKPEFDDDDEITLTVPVKPPRYIPSAAEVDSQELYGDAAASADTAPPEPGVSTNQEFSTSCPVCHTRLVVRQSQVGQNIRCPDCETQFQVRPPKRAPKPAPTLEEGEEFRLSDVFERPKYKSTDRDAVSRETLDVFDILHPSPPPPRDEPARPQSDNIDFFVVCPTCGSRVGANEQQVGQKIRCSDCTSEVVVRAPTRKSAASRPPVMEVDDITFTDEPVAPPVAAAAPHVAVAAQPREAEPFASERRDDVVEAASRAAMVKAEEEARQRDAQQRLVKLPPFKQLFSILADPAVLFRLLWMSIIVLLELSMFALIVQLSGSAMVLLPVLVLFMVGFGIPLLGYGSTSMVAIVQGTAGGQVRIEEWNDDFFQDSLGAFLQVIVAVSVSTLPGVVLFSLATTYGMPTHYSLLFVALSLFLLFPFVFLSELEGGHPFHVLSLHVAMSIRRAPGAWLRCYAECLVLLLLAAPLLLISLSPHIILRVLAALGLLTIWTLVLRSVGILAFACNRALLDNTYAARMEDSLE